MNSFRNTMILACILVVLSGCQYLGKSTYKIEEGDFLWNGEDGYYYHVASLTKYREIESSKTARIWTSTSPVGYFQWGRLSDFHQFLSLVSEKTTTKSYSIDTTKPLNSSFIITDEDAIQWRGDDWLQGGGQDSARIEQWNTHISSPCPYGFRIPTIEELEAEGNDIAETLNLQPSGIVNPKGEVQTSVNLSHIKDNLPNITVDNIGSLWSSSVDENGYAQGFLYTKFWGMDVTHAFDASKNIGASIRCIKDVVL